MLLEANTTAIAGLVDHPDQSETHLSGSQAVRMEDQVINMPCAELVARVNADGLLLRLAELDRLDVREQEQYGRVSFLKPFSIPGKDAVAVNDRFLVGVRYPEHVTDAAKAVVRESVVRHNIAAARTADDLADVLEIIKGFGDTTTESTKVIDNARYVLRALQDTSVSPDQRGVLLGTVTNKAGLRSKIDSLTTVQYSSDLSDIGAAHVELPEPPRSGGAKGPGWFQRVLSGLSGKRKE